MGSEIPIKFAGLTKVDTLLLNAEKLALAEIDKYFDLTDFRLETVPLALLKSGSIYGFLADPARNPADIMV